MCLTVKTAPMIRTRLSRLAAVAACALLVCSCSGPDGKPAAINYDAASRCVQNIDDWKKKLTELDTLQKEYDSVSEQVRVRYRKATAEERTQLRAKLGDISSQTDDAEKAADALFSEIMRELEYVPRDKTVRARLALITVPLKDTDGARTPEVQRVMEMVSSQLQVLLRVD